MDLLISSALPLSSARSRRGASWWTCSSALPCPLAPRGVVGARRDGLPHQLFPLMPVVCHGLCLCERLPLYNICQPTSSVCLFFACFQWFPEVSLWLGRLILSRGHSISVFVASQLPAYLRMVLYSLWWFFRHAHWRFLALSPKLFVHLSWDALYKIGHLYLFQQSYIGSG